MNSAAVQSLLGIRLNRPLRLGVAEQALAVNDLSATGRRRLRSVPPVARADWLRGRAALALLLPELTKPVDQDPAVLGFPHPQLSLSHAGGLAVAISCRNLAGIGIDYEPERPVPATVARWFLSSSEAKVRGNVLLRLWTVKEALFKACPDNSGLLLTDFELANPGSCTGVASCGHRPDLHFHYTSLRFARGSLSVALCTEADTFSREGSTHAHR